MLTVLTSSVFGSAEAPSSAIFKKTCPRLLCGPLKAWLHGTTTKWEGGEGEVSGGEKLCPIARGKSMLWQAKERKRPGKRMIGEQRKNKTEIDVSSNPILLLFPFPVIFFLPFPHSVFKQWKSLTLKSLTHTAITTTQTDSKLICAYASTVAPIKTNYRECISCWA